MTEIKELLSVVQQQRTYFQTHETLPISFRIEQLKKLKLFLKDHESELLVALSNDLGKHPTESYATELGLLYHSLDTMIKQLPKWQRKQPVKTPFFLWPAKSYTLASPYGNTLILSAFNYPLLLTIDPLIGAISGGNTAIIGLSEQSTQVNQVIISNYKKYFDENYLYFYVSSIDKNTAILKEKFEKIFFTGSPKVGKIVYQAASHHLTPVTLELGGKSPALVTRQANVKEAAKKIAWGKFLNAGQTCIAPDYCLVDESIGDEFVIEVKQAIKTMFNDNIEASNNFSRLTTEDVLERLLKLIDADRSFLVSGGKFNLKTKYLEPTILKAKISDKLVSMTEEIFGPILPILTYSNIEEALIFIEGYEPPLAFYPFSENKTEVTKLLSRIQFGGATVNNTMLHLSNINLPFGGVGQSGMGHYHGRYSFETFTHKKSVLVRSSKLNLPIMIPPYTHLKDKIIRYFLK